MNTCTFYNRGWPTFLSRDSKYFRFCGPNSLLINTQLWWNLCLCVRVHSCACAHTHKQSVNTRPWLFSNKTLFAKTGRGPDFGSWPVVCLRLFLDIESSICSILLAASSKNSWSASQLLQCSKDRVLSYPVLCLGGRIFLPRECGPLTV